MSSIVVGVVAGLLACLLGRWGWANAGDLAQRTDHRDDYHHRVQVLRRGAAACVAAGLFLGVGSIVAVALKV